MTLYNAYLKARDKANRDGLTLLASCIDYGDCWGFCFTPPPQKSLEDELNGLGEITIDKKTGAIAHFIPTMDFDKYDRGKPLPIDQFAEIAAVA